MHGSNDRREERGQSEAIGRNILEMAQLEVPIIATVIGEGGSGGALAIGVADQVLMLQFSAYSVISPEGCASILWKSSEEVRISFNLNYNVSFFVDRIRSVVGCAVHENLDLRTWWLDHLVTDLVNQNGLTIGIGRNAEIANRSTWDNGHNLFLSRICEAVCISSGKNRIVEIPKRRNVHIQFVAAELVKVLNGSGGNHHFRFTNNKFVFIFCGTGKYYFVIG